MASCRAGSGKGGGRIVEDERPVVAGRGLARRASASAAAIGEGADRRHGPVARPIPGGADLAAGSPTATRCGGGHGIEQGEDRGLPPDRQRPGATTARVQQQQGEGGGGGGGGKGGGGR